MPSNKDRLYVALYFHEREETFHWAFFVSPKSDPDAPNHTVRYHVTNKLVARGGAVRSTWEYEEVSLQRVKTAKLLARVLVGKVERSRAALEGSLRKVPVVQDNAEWRCRTWASNAVAQLAQDKILSGSSVTDWPTIEAESRAYVRRKEAEGRFKTWTDSVPTYDLMTKRETIP